MPADRRNGFRSTVRGFAGLALATLLLAPGAARADDECGAATGNPASVSCPNADHTGGIVYNNQARSITLIVQGGHSSDHSVITTGTDGTRDSGVFLSTSVSASSSHNVAVTVGSAGEADIRQGATTQADGADNNRGILIRQQSGGTTRLTVANWVTIGTSTSKMKAEGILLEFHATAARSAGAVTVSAQPDIYSEGTGIAVDDYPGTGAVSVATTANTSIATDEDGVSVSHTGSAGDVTITHAGSITSASSTTHRGIEAVSTGKDSAGANHAVTVTSSGTVSVTSGGAGIHAAVGAPRQETDTMHASYVAPLNAGLAKVDVTGGSVSAKGSAVQAFNYEAGSVRVDVASGVVLTSTQGYGIRTELTDAGNTSGTIAVINAGTIKAGTMSTGVYHGIAASRAAGSGNVSVNNRGAVEASGDGISAMAAGGGGNVTVANTGNLGAATSKVDRGIFAAHNGSSGNVTVTNSAAIMATDYGVFARIGHADNATGRIRITQSEAISGRTGVHAEVLRAGAAGETRAGSAQPLIDIAWTGTFAQPEAATSAGAGRPAADSSGGFVGPIALHAEVPAAETAPATRYGTAAGIEAGVMSWRDLAKEVAKGDDPGAIADKAAQDALFAAGADAATKARAAAALATFRSQLDNPGAIPDVNTVDANNDNTHSDAEITAYLTTDNANRRAFLRNILREHLSEAEQAVLRAAVTDAGLDAALDAGGFTGTAYRTAVRGFLDRFNAGNIRIAVNDGSINSGGDGVRAYYATPHDSNGSIEVTVAEGVSVTGGVAGIYVANAGMATVGKESTRGEALDLTGDTTLRRQFVTVDGTVTGGTDAAVHLSGGGALLVGETGKVYAGSSGRAILVNDPGHSEIVIHGEVRGGAGAPAAIDVTGGGRVVIGPTGSVDANGADRAIRAHYATSHDSNGAIEVTVAEGVSVAGGMAGIYVANAGMAEVAADSDRGRSLYLPEGTTVTLRRQFVTVDGTVTGGTDAAVHLSGGGALLVGEKGKVYAGSSGRAILVNDPGRSEIVILGAVRGGAGAPAAIDVTGGGRVVIGLTGSVDANGATHAIRAGRATPEDAPTRVVLYAPGAKVEGGLSWTAARDAAARVRGDIGGEGLAADNPVVFRLTDDEGVAGQEVPRRLVNGRPDISGLPGEPDRPQELGGGSESGGQSGSGQGGPGSGGRSGAGTGQAGTTTTTMNCDAASDDRCRLYEALPSVLLAMNGLPTRGERLAAARSEAGGWARVETARGEWTADSSTRAGVAYDRARSGVRVGVDGAVGETGLFGLSLHGLRGSADMTQNGGKVELSGVGLSVSGAAEVGDGVYIDAQAGATRYDVKLTSKTGRILKNGATGTGYALAVEAGRPVAVGDGVTLTPRAGFVWSRASLGDFRDSRLATPVSMQDAESLTGRAGVGVEMTPGGAGGLRVFGSAEATHEFSGETEARVLDASLKASPETTGARFALGAAHGLDEGRFALQASATYATGGSDGDGFGGGLSLSVRF